MEFTRRQVIASGAALATVSAFSNLASSAAVAAPLEVQEPLSVGYLDGSEETPDLRRLYLTTLRGERRKGVEEFRVVPASSLSGDPRMQGLSVRMAIMGLYPSKSLDRSLLPAGIDVDVLSSDPYSEKQEPLRHFSWTFLARQGNESPPTRSTYTAGPERGFGFDILERPATRELGETARRVLRGQAGKAVSVRRSGWFAFGRESSQPRLQRGVYLLGLQPGVWDEEVVLPISAKGGAIERLAIVVLVESAALLD